MIVNFTNILQKAESSDKISVSVSLLETVTTGTQPFDTKSIKLIYDSLSAEEKAVVNAFINLMKAKL